MASYPLTVHLGSNEAGAKRFKAYKEYAARQGKSVSEIVVALMDAVVGLSTDKKINVDNLKNEI